MTDSLPPVSSPSPPPASSSSVSRRPSHVQDAGATMVSLGSIGAITAAWLKGLLSGAPWWVPLVGIVLCGLPVSIRTRVLGGLLPFLRNNEKKE